MMAHNPVASLIALREPARVFAQRAVEQLRALFTLGTTDQLVDPSHGIAWRIKEPGAIGKKLLSGKSGHHVNDLVGIRILGERLHQLPAIEAMVGSWSQRIGLSCLRRENVFEHPDQSGYRSIHLDYQFLCPEDWSLTTEASVEIQITTWLQHFHNSLAHRLYYKPELSRPPGILAALSDLFAQVEAIEQRVDQLLRR